ncbi:MAG: hypothetical protein ABSF70_01530 [Terracidiphilus sp.]|jgi:hypothetical protein
MATQALQNFDTESCDLFRLGDILPKHAWAYYGTEAPASINESEYTSGECVADENCLRGLVVAIGMEVFTALCVFGIWRAWHFLL